MIQWISLKELVLRFEVVILFLGSMVLINTFSQMSVWQPTTRPCSVLSLFCPLT